MRLREPCIANERVAADPLLAPAQILSPTLPGGESHLRKLFAEIAGSWDHRARFPGEGSYATGSPVDRSSELIAKLCNQEQRVQ